MKKLFVALLLMVAPAHAGVTTYPPLVSTNNAGLAPTSPSDATKYLNGVGAYSVPSGNASGANPTATCGPAAVNGVATTFMRSDAAPACQTATSLQQGLVQGDGSTLNISAGVMSVVTGTGTGGSAELWGPPSTGSFTAGSGDGTTPTLTATSYGMLIDFGATTAGGILRYATATMPSAPWTVRTRVKFTYVQRAFRQIGFCISDGTKFYTFNYIGENNSGSDVPSFLEVQSWTNKTTFGSVIQHDTYYPPMYLEISYSSGAGVTFLTSDDGRNFVQFLVIASPAFTPTVAGFCVNPGATDNTVTSDHLYATVQYFGTP